MAFNAPTVPLGVFTFGGCAWARFVVGHSGGVMSKRLVAIVLVGCLVLMAVASSLTLLL
ncbi:energy-converting hydrogenase Eha subunit G [Prauserella sediminis]|uniref:Energy-converting hydrogenase Eha subunit G n=1 Tax=Prauserella sediminis TaxID=577680 RepID=A0A839XJM9_9PSEU|nr:hypothetical protein [Prauserella sediminis]MBB3662951.1 energy-converting hydrogenase Eha subunit G [Prauserella sediminis]